MWKQSIESPRDALEISASSWMELDIPSDSMEKQIKKNLVFFYQILVMLHLHIDMSVDI